MRQVTTALVVGIALVQSGCIPDYLRPFKDRRDLVPTGKVPSKEELVDYLNKNSERVQSLRSSDISLSCYYGIMPMSLSAKMACEKPRNLRLVVSHGVGSTEVDLGSNRDEFWWWIKRGEPYQFFCSYKDLEEGRVKAELFPFQPEWIMEALGIGNYGTPDQYVGVTADRDGTIRLTKRTRTPQGRPVLKVIVFNGRQTDVARGVAQVVQHQLIDEATKRLLVSAEISRVQMDPRGGGVVPRVMTLKWPAAKLQMTMNFDNLVVNAPIANTEAFTRRRIENIEQVNLALVPSPGVQRVQGRAP